MRSLAISNQVGILMMPLPPGDYCTALIGKVVADLQLVRILRGTGARRERFRSAIDL